LLYCINCIMMAKGFVMVTNKRNYVYSK